MLSTLGNLLGLASCVVRGFFFIYLIKFNLFNVTWIITYPPSEYHPIYTLLASHTRLPTVFQTCCALSHFCALAHNLPFTSTAILCASLFYSAQVSPPPCSLSRHSPHPWTSPLGEGLWQLVSLPPIFLSQSILHSAARVIFLKCKSHISLLLEAAA